MWIARSSAGADSCGISWYLQWRDAADLTLPAASTMLAPEEALESLMDDSFVGVFGPMTFNVFHQSSTVSVTRLELNKGLKVV